MPDIFDEVQEDLRAERAKRLFNRYAGLLAGAALLVVGAVAGSQGWRWWQERGAMAAAEGYLAAARSASEQGTDAAAAAGRFAAVASEAFTVEDILAETAVARVTERGATRADDRISEAAMEDRKKDGYF